MNDSIPLDSDHLDQDLHPDRCRERFKVASEFRTEVNRRLNEAGIEIPFPQRVVRITRD